VFNRNSVDHHLYADNKQLYSATTVTDIDTTRDRLVNCILDVREWCSLSKTTVRCAKTQTGMTLVWFESAANIRKMSAKNLTLSAALTSSRQWKWCATSASILTLS